MQNLKDRIQQLKKKRPGYGEILDSYQKIKEALDKVETSLKIDPIELEKASKKTLSQTRFLASSERRFPAGY